MLLKYANNAGSTLQSGITATATTAALATGTGSIFPTITGDQAFYMTFQDAATQQENEIVKVIAITADSVTMLRGQQGTAQRAWNAGDFARELLTMADAANFVQPDQIQEGSFTTATSVGGSVNSITASLQSTLQSLPDMMHFTVEATGANTGAVTLTLTFAGSAVTLPSHPVQKFGASGLNAADIPAAGFPIELVWSATLAAYIMTNPASGSAGSIAGGAANDLLVQTAPSTTGFVAAPTIAGQVLAFVGGALSWIVAAVTSFNGRGGAVVPQTGDYNAAQVGAVATSAFQAPNVSFSNPNFCVLPNGVIMQWGNRATAGARDSVTFPKAFPTSCDAIVVSADNQSSAIFVSDAFLSTTSFQYQVNATRVSWVAFGH